MAKYYQSNGVIPYYMEEVVRKWPLTCITPLQLDLFLSSLNYCFGSLYCIE